MNSVVVETVSCDICHANPGEICDGIGHGDRIDKFITQATLSDRIRAYDIYEEIVLTEFPLLAPTLCGFPYLSEDEWEEFVRDIDVSER